MAKINISRRAIFYSVGQALLIIVGVSVAIWFENLNEERKEREFEKVLLSEMINNLKVDLKWISNELRTLERGISSSNKIITLLNDKKLNTDSLKNYIIDIGWYSTAVFNAAAYEAIKSKGLDLVRNNELRQAITQYYEVSQKDMLDQVRIGYNMTWNFYAPNVNTKFKSYSMSGGAEPRNLEKLREDEDFKQGINILITFKELQLSQFTSLKEKAEKLLEAVTQETEK